MKIKRLLPLFICLLAAVLVLTPFVSLCATPEWSADMFITADGKTSTGKVYVKADKIRQEIIEKGSTSITILRLDKKVAWTLLGPPLNRYIEVALPNAPDQPQNEQYVITKHGTEMIAGYLCDVMTYTYKDKKLGSMTTWVSQKLQYGLKLENKDSKGKVTSVTEHKNIQEGPQPDSLFEIPAGYSKMLSFGKP